MLDPSRFMHAGLDEVGRAIGKLVEGPEFADIGSLEREGLETSREWLALRKATAAHQAVTTAAWSRAFAEFGQEMAGAPAMLMNEPRAALDRWLAIANAELVRTQRTDEFLKTQRSLIRAGVDYRLKERELVEKWCEAHSMPTRTEVDELHRAVYELRRELRRLRKAQVAASAEETGHPAEAPRRTTRKAAPRGAAPAKRKVRAKRQPADKSS